jgi:hypothetical protein
MISRSPEAGVKVTPRRGPVHLGLVETSGDTGWILLVRFVSTFTDLCRFVLRLQAMLNGEAPKNRPHG